MHEEIEPRRRISGCARVELGERQWPEQAQQVVQLVRIARSSPFDEVLQLELEVGEHGGIEELAQLLRPEQVAQQIAVERERGGAPLGQWRVAFVHVDGDPREQQRLRERRRPRRVDGNDADRT